ncbi:MAG: helix-turn-helix domain-containing protein [Nocardioides sp.]|nr:helix-turn-helix domain-containing protein [Nocardioides sp.]
MTTDRRSQVLEALRAAEEPLGVSSLARQIGVHVNTVRFHLDVLEKRGQVDRVEPERRTPGRPPLLYQARRVMDPVGPRDYRMLATILAASLSGHPDGATRAVAAGQEWGRVHVGQLPSRQRRDGVETLVEVLDDLGFAPRREGSDPAPTVALRHCPFIDLVADHAEVICPIHLGLMQGIVGAVDDSVTVERLDPLVEPDLCITHLTRA